MKNKIIGLALVLFLLFNSTFTFSQDAFTVNNNNLSTTVNNIFALYGDRIDQNYAAVHDFLSGLLVGSSTTGCSPPNVEVTSVSNTDISFAWSAVNNASSYHSSYLKLNNLSQPNSGTFNTALTSITITIPNGLTIFAFQAECNTGLKSELYIIIVDKPSFLVEAAMACDCVRPEYSSAIFPNPAPDLSSVFLEYTHSGSSGFYEGYFYSELYATAHFFLRVNQYGLTLVIEDIGTCKININNGASMMYIINEEGGGILGTLSFGESGFLLTPVSGYEGSFELTECTGLNRDEGEVVVEDTPAEIQLSPNPVQTSLSVQIPLLENEGPASLFLVDAFGQQVHRQMINLEQSAYPFQLDVRTLPVGIYYVLVEMEDRTIQKRFIKM